MVAVVPQPLHAFTVEQVGNLTIAGQAHRRLTAFLAEHPTALCRDHAVGLRQAVDNHYAVACRGDLEDAASAIIQFAADQQAAIRLRQQRCGLGHITMQHLDIPTSGSLDRVETLPGEKKPKVAASKPVVAVRAMRALRWRRNCGM